MLFIEISTDYPYYCTESLQWKFEISKLDTYCFSQECICHKVEMKHYLENLSSPLF